MYSLVTISPMAAASAQPATAGEPNLPEAFRIINEEANAICGPEISLTNDNMRLSAHALADLEARLKLLGQLGFTGGVDGQYERKTGILQSQFASAIKDRATCKVSVLNMMFSMVTDGVKHITIPFDHIETISSGHRGNRLTVTRLVPMDEVLQRQGWRYDPRTVIIEDSDYRPLKRDGGKSFQCFKPSVEANTQYLTIKMTLFNETDHSLSCRSTGVVQINRN